QLPGLVLGGGGHRVEQGEVVGGRRPRLLDPGQREPAVPREGLDPVAAGQIEHEAVLDEPRAPQTPVPRQPERLRIGLPPPHGPPNRSSYGRSSVSGMSERARRMRRISVTYRDSASWCSRSGGTSYPSRSPSPRWMINPLTTWASSPGSLGRAPVSRSPGSLY